jgi:hypothetical protein
LIQAVTEERFTGHRVEDGIIVAMGHPPYQVREIAGTVELRFSKPQVRRVNALNLNGEREREIDLQKTNSGTVSIKLPPNHLYTVIER